LDQTVKTSQHEIKVAEENGNDLLRGIVTARAAQAIREHLTPAMLEDVKQLMNVPQGFRTDRDPIRSRRAIEAYSDDVIRDVLIVALLDGAKVVGNEFNIISGNYYRTVAQLQRRIHEWPGLTDFRYDLAVPKNAGGGALVGAKASWLIDGKADSLECVEGKDADTRLPVRVNEGQGADAILGKARRKLFFRILERLAGRNLEDEEGTGEAASDDMIDGQVVDHQPQADPQPEPFEPAPPDPAPQSMANVKLRFVGLADSGTVADATRLYNEVVERDDLTDTAKQVLKEWFDECVKTIRNRRADPVDVEPPVPYEGQGALVREAIDDIKRKRTLDSAYACWQKWEQKLVAEKVDPESIDSVRDFYREKRNAIKVGS